MEEAPAVELAASLSAAATVMMIRRLCLCFEVTDDSSLLSCLLSVCGTSNNYTYSKSAVSLPGGWWIVLEMPGNSVETLTTKARIFACWRQFSHAQKDGRYYSVISHFLKVISHQSFFACISLFSTAVHVLRCSSMNVCMYVVSYD